MNLIERRRNLLVFTTICLCIVGLFFIILANRDNVSVASNASNTDPGTPHVHSWTQGIVVSAATCTQPERIKCDTCSTTTARGSALGHAPGSGPTCTTAQVCTRSGCGATIASATGHSLTETVTHSNNNGKHTVYKKCANFKYKLLNNT